MQRIESEEVGFEPTVHLHAHTLSKRAPSATRTLLQKLLKRVKGYPNYSLSYKEKPERAHSLSLKDHLLNLLFQV